RRTIPSAGGGQRLRLPAGDARQVARRIARAPSRIVVVEHRHLRDGPSLRTVAVADARAPTPRSALVCGTRAERIAQGDPLLLATGRRRGTRGRVVGLPGLDARTDPAGRRPSVA